MKKGIVPRSGIDTEMPDGVSVILERLDIWLQTSYGIKHWFYRCTSISANVTTAANVQRIIRGL